jgi:1-acyl-sn-glycerol-3-phosphate acyltransferase
MKIPLTAPLPSIVTSVQRWLSAAFHTTLYGIPELTHLLAFNFVRRCRQQAITNEYLRACERYFLTRAEFYRHRWGHAFCSTFGIDVQTEYRFDEPISSNERVLFVILNQQSMLETPILGMISNDQTRCKQCQHVTRLVSLHFLFMNIEFALIPFFGWNCALRGIVIQRGKQQSTRAGVQQLIERTRMFNDNFCMSIEGQRSRDGRLNVYKKGAAIMAIQSQSDIIPITFENAGHLWAYGQWRIRPGQVKVVFHERISVENMTLADKDALTQRLQRIGETELQRMNHGLLHDSVR